MKSEKFKEVNLSQATIIGGDTPRDPKTGRPISQEEYDNYIRIQRKNMVNQIAISLAASMVQGRGDIDCPASVSSKAFELANLIIDTAEK